MTGLRFAPRAAELGSHVRLVALAALVTLPSCMFFETGGSKVRAGTLYAAGDPGYDDYFRRVHDYQTFTPHWAEGRVVSRAPLAEALGLPKDSAPPTLARAAQDKAIEVARTTGPFTLELNAEAAQARIMRAGGPSAVTPPFCMALETTARMELEREKKLKVAEEDVDELLKRGRDLEAHAHMDFAKEGDRKVAHVDEELKASVEVLESVQAKARQMGREADDFVWELQRSVAATGPGVKGGGPRHKAGHGEEHGAPPPRTDAPPPARKKVPPRKASEVFAP